jgi:hypothetical protein
MPVVLPFLMVVLITAETCSVTYINRLTLNDPYEGRTAPLTSKRCILYIYSTNTGTKYFKHGIYSPFLSSSKCSLFHNSNVFGSCVIHILYTGCAKIKKNNSSAKRLSRSTYLWLNSPILFFTTQQHPSTVAPSSLQRVISLFNAPKRQKSNLI